MNKLVFAVIAVVILALAGGVYLSKDNDDSVSSTDQVADTTASTEANETENKPQTEAEEEIEVPAAGSQGILEYSPEALAASETEDNIVFFHAKWCTICNSVERNIQAGNIPDTLSIFKVDYDSDEGQALAEKYEIGPQYTMVQVNADGTEITKWVNQFNYGIEDVVNNLI